MSDCAKVGKGRLAGAVFVELFFMAGIVAGSGMWGDDDIECCFS